MSLDTDRPSKPEMQRDLQVAWDGLCRLIDAVPEGEMEVPGVVEGWSMKDLLGHVAFWASKAAHDLDALTRGRPEEIEAPDDEQALDAWNDREYKRRKDLPLTAVRAEFEQSFAAAKRALAAVPEDVLWQEVMDSPQAVRFREDTYNHYHEHSAHVKAWIRQLDTSEA